MFLFSLALVSRVEITVCHIMLNYVVRLVNLTDVNKLAECFKTKSLLVRRNRIACFARMRNALLSLLLKYHFQSLIFKTPHVLLGGNPRPSTAYLGNLSGTWYRSIHQPNLENTRVCHLFSLKLLLLFVQST